MDSIGIQNITTQSINVGDIKISGKKQKETKINIDTLTHTHTKQKTLAQCSARKTKINMHVQKNTKNKKDNKISNIDSI